MSAVGLDCCAEPVAGPVVDGRMLRHAWAALGPLACGDWPAAHSLVPGHRAQTLAVLDEVLAGLYLAVDSDGRLRWLGKAHRDGGVGARLRDHFRHPERSRVYAGVFVVAADPFSPPQAIKAAEGRAADLIGLRGRMGPRTYPRAVARPGHLAPGIPHRPSPPGR
ncbi:hypothetical protein [Streptomyces scabiei]|uniref:hypothetical protein n=1 Tax=Streptomyces scabiei TaxID=1930 RepID=UPI000A67818D|nr:hypothetical protein [Streptomyces scabiei]MDX2540051.1 hypothetical protein [Streptomyces scabiei]MDX2802352.1 hypothetical protein [Streptomyces scabiei]MDX2858360.1 hypothetical protein [Streptomyces scabiei]MDX3030878.1 hypothetical protein [Streptomyces scabiei]MDX3211602.1 hypothetical protein [Streptomyces scabiei]